MGTPERKLPAAELTERICSRLLQCETHLGLYPRDHPRVRASLSEVREDLRAFERELGQPFRLDVASVLDGEEPPSRSAGELARRLERLLVETATFPEDTPETELCRFLDRLPRAGWNDCEDADRVLLDLEGLDRLQLGFCELRELPGVVPERAASRRRRGRNAGTGVPVDRFLGGIEEEIREPLVEALQERELRHRLERLATLLEGQDGDSARNDDDLSLLQQLVRAAARDARGDDGAVPSPGSVVDRLEAMLGFFELNAPALLASGDLERHGVEGRLDDQELQRFGRSCPTLATELRRLQCEKRRLADLFRVSTTQETVTAVQATRSGGTPAEGAAPSRPADPPSGNAWAELETIEYDLEGIETALRGHDPWIPWTQVVLELLGRDRHRGPLRRRFSVIRDTLLAKVRHQRRLSGVMAVLCRCLAAEGSEDAKDLLLALLARADDQATLRRLVEETVRPEGGLGLVRDVLSELADRERQAALPLLCGLAASSDKSLRSTAVKRLARLAANPALLAVWARDAPETLLDGWAFEQLVHRLGVRRVGAAFREYFATAQPESACAFLRGLDPDWEGCEEVLISAADHAEPTVRREALGLLHRHPSDAVVDMLIEVVKRNEYLGTPDPEELRGALSALLQIGKPRAQEFLDGIEQRRGLFGHRHHKVTRRVLMDLRRSREGT